MTDIQRLDEGHRRWGEIERGGATRSDEAPRTEKPAQPVQPHPHPALGSGVLQADIIRSIAAIEVPAKEDVAKSVEYVSERISSNGGAMLAAQANVVPPRALALLTDAA